MSTSNNPNSLIIHVAVLTSCILLKKWEVTHSVYVHGNVFMYMHTCTLFSAIMYSFEMM